jgi:hypothetical protein
MESEIFVFELTREKRGTTRHDGGTETHEPGKVHEVTLKEGKG